MLLADFHIHTTWSDGQHDLAEVVALFGRSGHDVIAITDRVTRATFAAYREEIEREKRRALDEYGMIVVAGIELKTDDTHLLALGVDEFISTDGTVDELLDRAHRMSRAVVACELQDPFAQRVDLWEFPSIDFARHRYIGSSDFHTAEHVYAWKTLVPSRPNEMALFRALNQGTGLAVTRLEPPLFAGVGA